MEIKMNNNERYDLNDRLIHFFKPLDAEDPSFPGLPEYLGFNNEDIGDCKYSALFLLRCCIRNDKLWATWSYRGNARSVYGPNPAVCFTEMPFAAFVEAARSRSKKAEKISIYGLSFKKTELFSIGARHVIYGLSNPSAVYPDSNKGGPRIFEERYLPSSEQFRYITYNPSIPRPVDWTHEREWRLPYRGDLSKYENQISEFGIVESSDDVPGFYLSKEACNDIGIIIDKKKDAHKILYDILCLIYRGTIAKNKYQFLICAEKIKNTKKYRDYYQEQKLIKKSLIPIEDYLKKNTKLAFSTKEQIERYFCSSFEKIISSGNNYPYEDGKCWVWFYNVFDKRVLAMLNEGLLIINNENKILFELETLDSSLPLQMQEEMIQNLSVIIKKKLKIQCGYYSVRDSKNCNDVPYYCSQDLGDLEDLYYNKSNDC